MQEKFHLKFELELHNITCGLEFYMIILSDLSVYFHTIPSPYFHSNYCFYKLQSVPITWLAVRHL